MDIWERLAARKPQAPEQIRIRGGSESKSEVARIIMLPQAHRSLWDGSDARKAEGLSLRPLQQEALGAIAQSKGGFFPLAVGAGKTYISVLAGAASKADLAILLVPPRTVQQTYDALDKADSCFHLPRTEVIPYSRLSQPDATDLLERLIAGLREERVLVVADEAHNLKRHESARTKRVARFLSAHPLVRFIAMSGTLTSKSIKDFAHLAEWALRGGSPVPRPSNGQGRMALQHWSACMDSDGRPAREDWVWCEPLWQWGGCKPANVLMATTQERKDGLRSALSHRISITQGVVATKESSLGTALYITHWRSLKAPAVIAEAMDEVERTQCRPDGAALESPVDQWRVQRQLSQGFYYRWVWPNGVVDIEWLDARSAWAKAVRNELNFRSCAGYDSPLLVNNKTAREHASGMRLARHRAWEDWQKVKDRPPPPVEAVWLTTEVLDTVIRDVLSSREPTLIWYADEAVAVALAQRGIETVGAGKPVPTGKARTLAVSVKSHGTGLNLQPWAHNMILNPDGSGLVWEQLLGRTHRPGQEADEVCATVLAHTFAARDAMAKARQNADYIQHTTGQEQKLLLATHTEK